MRTQSVKQAALAIDGAQYNGRAHSLLIQRLARIFHRLASRERPACRSYGALGREADGGGLEQSVEEAGERRPRRCGALGSRSSELNELSGLARTIHGFYVEKVPSVRQIGPRVHL
jgi:hypothetical protein